MSRKEDKKTVLITGGRAPVALESARIFCKAGYRVVGAESFGHNLLTLSRSVDKNYRVASPRLHFEEYKKEILEIVVREKVDLLLPTCEEVYYIAKFKEELSRHCLAYVPHFDVLNSLHSKWLFIETARKQSLKVPATHKVSSAGEVRKLRNLYKEMVLKPEYSRFGNRVLFLKTEADLEGLETLMQTPGNWIAQEFVPGRQISTYSLCQDGSVTAHSAYTSEFTLGPGAFIAFESIVHDKILRWIQAFSNALKLTGQVAFDFIESSRDGEAYAIECNPRMTSGIHLLAPQAGLADCFLGEGVHSGNGVGLLSPQEGAKGMALSAMGLHALQNIRTRQDFRKWSACLRASRDNIFAWHDPLPFCSQFIGIANLAYLAQRQKLSLLEASTWDIEFNGEPGREIASI